MSSCVTPEAAAIIMELINCSIFQSTISTHAALGRCEMEAHTFAEVLVSAAEPPTWNRPGLAEEILLIQLVQAASTF